MTGTVDKVPAFWWFEGVKFLPRASSLLLLTTALSLSACATAANRRALYFPAKPGGLWHDYETRRIAEAQTGVNTAAYSTAPVLGAPTKLPPSRPVPSGSDVGAPPPTNGPAAQVPGNPAVLPSADAGLPQTPATPAIPSEGVSVTPPQ